jgi:hypothetical protein
MNLHETVLDYIENSELYRGEISWEGWNGCVKILNKSTFKEEYFKSRPNISKNCENEANLFIEKFNDNLTLYKISDSNKMRSGYLLVDGDKNEIDFLHVVIY